MTLLSESEHLSLVPFLLHPDEEEAKRSWQSWRARYDPHEIKDFPVIRLYPLVYQRLTALEIDDVRLGILRGAYRRTWYVNQVLFRRAAEVIKQLASSDIEVMLPLAIVASTRIVRVVV